MKSTKFITKRKNLFIVYEYFVREGVEDKKSSGELARCRHYHSDVLPEDWFTEIGYDPPLFRLRDLSKGDACINFLLLKSIICKFILNLPYIGTFR